MFLLPEPDELLKRSKSLAALDALCCQQWDVRYFSHNAHWGEGEQMASMRDGEGNGYFILFAPFGTAMKGTCIANGAFEDNAIADSARAKMPEKFADFLSEPTFSIHEASFIAWFDEKNKKWTKTESEKEDGSGFLTEIIRGDEETFRDWANVYYEIDLKPVFIEHVFQFMPIDGKFIEQLGFSLDGKQLLEDMDEIGYPHTGI